MNGAFSASAVYHNVRLVVSYHQASETYGVFVLIDKTVNYIPNGPPLWKLGIGFQKFILTDKVPPRKFSVLMVYCHADVRTMLLQS